MSYWHPAPSCHFGRAHPPRHESGQASDPSRRTPMIGDPAVQEPDVVLVGAGIMSATLAVCLKELEPALTIQMFETLDGPALESSDAWNNAGTGHAANCELNYTPERSDGSIDISE